MTYEVPAQGQKQLAIRRADVGLAQHPLPKMQRHSDEPC